jgi:predicted Fe-S protein YdhL (DUF1289 family)
MQETRQVRKFKKDTDTCRDCWTKRFRQEIYKYWKSIKNNEKGEIISLNDFLALAREHKQRQEMVDSLRARATDIYDEIAEIKAFAGDLYMDPSAIPTDES